MLGKAQAGRGKTGGDGFQYLNGPCTSRRMFGADLSTGPQIQQNTGGFAQVFLSRQYLH